MGIHMLNAMTEGLRQALEMCSEADAVGKARLDQ
jgi:hypothetical protein